MIRGFLNSARRLARVLASSSWPRDNASAISLSSELIHSVSNDMDRKAAVRRIARAILDAEGPTSSPDTLPLRTPASAVVESILNRIREWRQ